MTMRTTVRPNVFQRAVHRFLMLPAVTAFLIRALHPADLLLWKLNGGRFSFTSLLAGIPTFQVTTIGAKTQLRRTLALAAFPDGNRLVVIASNFGQARYPAWYHNLKATPQCWVLIDGKQRPYMAREAEALEYQHYWNLALSYYAGYALYKKNACARHIPIMMLEPVKQLPES